jgi:hypothetical protein
MPNLSLASQRQDDVTTDMQTASAIDPQLNMVLRAVAWVGDLTGPGSVLLLCHQRHDHQAAL